MMRRTMVSYFSATGTTERAAKVLAKAARADLFKIAPAEPYTQRDLNWNDPSSRTSVDLAGKIVVPFATSGGSGISHATERIRSLHSETRVLDGRMLNGSPSQGEVATWVKALEL